MINMAAIVNRLRRRSLKFPDRTKKDGIWDGQVKYFDENKIVENYLIRSKEFL